MTDMEPNAPTKRRWFQFHLSTCIVMMLAAGVVLWMNFRRPPEMWHVAYDHDIFFRYSGWPFCSLDCIPDRPRSGSGISAEVELRQFVDRNSWGVFGYAQDVIRNVGFGLLLILTIGVLWELSQRPRESTIRKTTLAILGLLLAFWLPMNLTEHSRWRADPITIQFPDLAMSGWPFVSNIPYSSDRSPSVTFSGWTANIVCLLIAATWIGILTQWMANNVSASSGQEPPEQISSGRDSKDAPE